MKSYYFDRGFDLTSLHFEFFVFQALSAASNQSKQPSHCVWYGQCHKDIHGNQYCPYNGTAKALATDGIAILQEWCPQFLGTLNTAKETCCDVEQLNILNTNIKLAANFLKRCPSCMNNLANHLCHFTCSPRQSDFINATIKTAAINNKTVEYVSGIDLYITTEYLEGSFGGDVWNSKFMFLFCTFYLGTYNSCKQVSVPSTGQLALDLMCGSWGSKGCSAQRWFTYMGDMVDNPYVPFQINYKNVSAPVGPFTPLDPGITPCSASLSVSRQHCCSDKTKQLNVFWQERQPACSCVDCEASCPAPAPQPPPAQPFLICGFDGSEFLMVVVFLAGTVVFLIMFLCSKTGSGKIYVKYFVFGVGCLLTGN